jgi:copper chaperone CopZ
METWMRTTIFRIEGMNCDACANTIKSLVEKEPGVRMASVSFAERQARVLYDPKATPEGRLVDVKQTCRQLLAVADGGRRQFALILRSRSAALRPPGSHRETRDNLRYSANSDRAGDYAHQPKG